MANRVSEEEQQEMIDLYQSGLSCHTIGQRVSRSDRTVWRVLVNAGVELREARRKMDVESHIGLKYGKWTVVRFDSIRGNNRLYWMCLCECGHEQALRAHELVSGGSLGCTQCCHSEFSNVGVVKNWHMRSIINKARIRNLDVSVDVAYLSDLFLSQGGMCALTGEPITIRKTLRSKEEQTASLDRIDSIKGYIPGNVQWVHKDVNKMKNNFTQDHFIGMCRKVALMNPDT